MQISGPTFDLSLIWKVWSGAKQALQETLAQDDFCDFTGYRFKMRQITVEVLSYADGDIRLGILNRGVL